MLLLGSMNSSFAQSPSPPDKEARIAALTAEMNDAIEKAKAIINQPVGALRRTPAMRVSTYSPGWFHEGAVKPNFNTADVRTTQELLYAKNQYVTSDLNPGYVFLGSHLEFNSQTKYFYVDRSLPKKKLTEAEMLEINRLYRIIGKCEREIDELQFPPPQDEYEEVEGEWVVQPVPKENYIKAAIGVAIVLGLYVVYLVVRRMFR
jgi:hypothetical protein